MQSGDDPRSTFRVRTFRAPGALGCLLGLVTIPLALLAGVITGILALLLPSRRSAMGGEAAAPLPRRPRGHPRAAIGAAGFALCSLVEKMSLDEEFGLADAQMAGIPVDTDVTIETLLGEAVTRGWVERRADRYAVTESGRRESAELLRRMHG